MNDAWDGSRPSPIPELPNHIAYGSIKTNKAALGLSTDRAQPVQYDWDSQHFLLISGIFQSGKSNLLYTVARQMKEKLGGKLYVFDIKATMPKSMATVSDCRLCDASEIDTFIEQLRPELQRRQEQKMEQPELQFVPLIITIDDYSVFFPAVSNDTIARLNAIVRIGGGLGLYLLVSGDAFDISSYCFKGEMLLLSMLRAKQAVALGGCLNDHSAIRSNATYQMKIINVNEDEGWFIRNSEPTRFKSMSFSEE